jgi:hypothetical protein
MKRVQPYLLSLTLCLPLSGCFSAETPQASAQLKKQFAGSPMPPDAQKEFQKGMQHSHELMQKQFQSGGRQ